MKLRFYGSQFIDAQADGRRIWLLNLWRSGVSDGYVLPDAAAEDAFRAWNRTAVRLHALVLGLVLGLPLSKLFDNVWLASLLKTLLLLAAAWGLARLTFRGFAHLGRLQRSLPVQVARQNPTLVSLGRFQLVIAVALLGVGLMLATLVGTLLGGN